MIIRTVLFILISALFAGCSWNDKRTIEMLPKLEVWDCRGDTPKRLSDADQKDIWVPKFADMQLPEK